MDFQPAKRLGLLSALFFYPHHILHQCENCIPFLCLISLTAMETLNTSVGKPLKTLPDLLREYNLPAGLFPQNITGYEFEESKAKLIVHLPSACEVSFKDSSILRYAPRVKCILMRGKLMGIEGMKTKVLVWVKVTNVSVEGHKSDKIWFTAGVKKPRSLDAYRVPCEAISVKEF